MSDLVSVARIEDLPPGSGCEVVAGDQIVALFNVDGTIEAIDGICPHAGGPLGEGQLNGCILTCPWHGWQFDVHTGRHCLTENIHQNKYEVEVKDGEIFVRVP